LLGKQDNKQQKHFGFVDFFPIEELAEENAGLDVITMEEYLQKVAMTGQLRDKTTGLVSFPPGNRTEWNGMDQKDYDVLREWLRGVTKTAEWNPGQCLPAFPQSGNHKDVEVLQQMVHEITEQNKGKKDVGDKFDGHPVPVDGSARDRLEENLAGRKQLCVYDEEMQQEHTIHFQCNHKRHLRMLVHFYAFLFFEVRTELSGRYSSGRIALFSSFSQPSHLGYTARLKGLEGRLVDEKICSGSH
jgi:hypothetical protein